LGVESQELLTKSKVFQNKILADRKALSSQPSKCRHAIMRRISSNRDLLNPLLSHLFASARSFEDPQAGQR
jgi:hypothetical protein